MKRITKNELPIELNTEIIEILVEMALEFPQTKEWHDVFDLLEERNQLMFILDIVEDRKKAIEKAREDAKSDEQKLREKEEWQQFLDNADPNGFYGNMGEPVTLEDYKLRYGVYPPGYDNDGNKI
jgi:hypothetical protein